MRLTEDTGSHACHIFGKVRDQNWMGAICGEANMWHIRSEILSHTQHKYNAGNVEWGLVESLPETSHHLQNAADSLLMAAVHMRA